MTHACLTAFRCQQLHPAFTVMQFHIRGAATTFRSFPWLLRSGPCLGLSVLVWPSASGRPPREEESLASAAFSHRPLLASFLQRPTCRGKWVALRGTGFRFVPAASTTSKYRARQPTKWKFLLIPVLPSPLPCCLPLFPATFRAAIFANVGL